MKSKLLIAIAVLVVLSAGWLFFMRSNGTTANKMPDQVSYNFHIRPILSDKCFKCHGPDKNKSYLLFTNQKSKTSRLDNLIQYDIIDPKLKRITDFLELHKKYPDML